MAKFKLNPDPTFKAMVEIQKAGSAPDEIEFTFKHRTRDQMDEFMKEAAEFRDADLIMKMAVGWDLEDEFNRESLNTLAQNFITAPGAIFQKYVDELVKAKQKN